MTHIYRPTHQRQMVGSDPFGKYNCTAYSAAMFVDAVTIGGSRVTGKQIRAWSNEPVPNIQSPGLNIPQVCVVLRRLGVACSDYSGKPWSAVTKALDEGRRVIAQVSYRELGTARCQSGDFGHAMLLQAKRARPGGIAGYEIFGNDPLCGAAKWYPDDWVRNAMEQFGDETHVPGPGLRFAISKTVPELP